MSVLCECVSLPRPELRERCLAAGFRPVPDEPFDGAERFHVFDPFGNRLELLERR